MNTKKRPNDLKTHGTPVYNWSYQKLPNRVVDAYESINTLNKWSNEQYHFIKQLDRNYNGKWIFTEEAQTAKRKQKEERSTEHSTGSSAHSEKEESANSEEETSQKIAKTDNKKKIRNRKHKKDIKNKIVA